MPREVISLLSSPEPAPSPPARNVSFPGHVSRAAAAAEGTKRATRALDCDIFSSDSFPAPSQSQKNAPTASQPAALPATNQTTSGIASRIRCGVAFSSDSVDTSWNWDGLPDPFGAGNRPSKRLRIYPPKEENAKSTVLAEKPANERLHNPFSDDDPFSPAHSPIRRLDKGKAVATCHIDLLSSPVVSAAPLPARRRRDNDDLFVTTHSPQWDKENEHRRPSPDRGLDIDLSDPFAESPPRIPRESALPKRTAAWDPISSSAPEIAPGGRLAAAAPSSRHLERSRSEVITLDDSEDSDNEDAEEEGEDKSSGDDELPDLAKVDFAKVRATMSTARKRSRPQEAPQKKKRAASSKPAGASKKTSEEKAREKAEKAAAREAEKERKKQEKERAKEQRALEKETAAALAEVNKLRIDKKVSAPEMIVDLPSSLEPATRLQAEALLGDLDVQHGSWASPVDNVVAWRRKVTSTYNADLGRWEPVPLRVEREKHAMVVMPATKFVELTLGLEGTDLEAHVLRMQRHFAEHTLIYLIEGLTAWMRKNRNVRNRQFVSAVRGVGAGSGDDPSSTGAPSGTQQQQPPARRRKNNNNTQEYIDEDAIEDALLGLQVSHGALIHHTNAPVETAQWIAVFTQHISTIPYRRQRERDNDAAAAFCMDAGQVRAGEDARDTYVRMLQEVARVTAPAAYGVAAQFGSVSELVRGLERGGPLALEACRKSANKDGAFSDRTVGQALSRRIHKVFTGTDETSTDI